jgi:hypothetical protein
MAVSLRLMAGWLAEATNRSVDPLTKVSTDCNGASGPKSRSLL